MFCWLEVLKSRPANQRNNNGVKTSNVAMVLSYLRFCTVTIQLHHFTFRLQYQTNTSKEHELDLIYFHSSSTLEMWVGFDDVRFSNSRWHNTYGEYQADSSYMQFHLRWFFWFYKSGNTGCDFCEFRFKFYFFFLTKIYQFWIARTRQKN